MVSKTATILIMIAKGSGEIPPGTVLAGVPLLRRIVMVASRAGYRDILVMDDGAEEVAEYLRVPVKSLYAWRYTRQGPPAARVGKYLRYRRTDVNAWLEERIRASVD